MIEEHALFLARLEELLVKQAEDHQTYARESSERMHELNKMMSQYIEIQKKHLCAYEKHIDRVVESRDIAQRNESIALEALAKEQAKNEVLLSIIKEMKCQPTSSVQVGTITP